MNTFLMHTQELACVLDLAVVHAFTSALPVALAVAEAKGGVTGRELLNAIRRRPVQWTYLRSIPTGMRLSLRFRVDRKRRIYRLARGHQA